MPKYQIEQDVQRHYADRGECFLWDVKIFADDGDMVVVRANGVADTEDKAIDYAKKFTRWAIRTHDELCELRTHDDD